MLHTLRPLKTTREDIAPMLDQKHIYLTLLLGSALFAISLAIGVTQQSLGFLCESLLLVTLMWASYRGSFPAALMLLAYLLLAKTYQLFFFSHLNIFLRSFSLLLTLILARGFYVAAKKLPLHKTQKKSFDVFDILFALSIGMVAISISAVAVDHYGVSPSIKANTFDAQK